MAQVSVTAPALSVGAPLPSVAGDACGLEPTSPLLAPPAGQCPVTATTNAIGTIIDGMSSVSLEENMANPKEKTPMCLVNELARYNKLQAQYKLVREEGPAHAKLFTVELALGEQTWEAEGSSIKKAQHSAATRALAETALPRPPARPPKHNLGTNPVFMLPAGSITPTVELNGMAMKLGLPVFYRHFDPPPMPGYRPNYNYRGMPHQRYHHPPMPRAFLVELQVGERKFTGEGRTRQAARHNAASNALKDLQSDPLPPKPAPDTQENGNEDEDEENDHDANKSEISQVFEIALKRNFPVNFEVVRESGPPHMKSFVTRLSVGQFSAEEEGKSKKLSKKKAAAIVLAELFKLPPLPVVEKPRPTLFKKKPKSIVKVSPEYSQGMNPISRLAQIQQAKKEREPDYTVVSERSLALRRREFIMQVKVGDDCATGTGPSKKIAKRNAAETLLLQLGYKPSLPAASPDDKCQPQEGEKPVDTRKVTFAEPASPNQKGILHLSADVYQQMEAARNRAGGPPPQQQQQHPAMGYGKKEPSWGGPGPMHPHGLGNATATIPRELLMKGGSPTAEAMVKVPPVHMVHACQQLDYLAREQGFQVQYMDMQHGKDVMSTLTILPLQIAFHGVGSTVEAARDQAALNTLKQLSEQGLDALASKGKPDKYLPGFEPKNSSVTAQHSEPPGHLDFQVNFNTM
uniref:Double-stranded RNA-binding protein Staufen homolog 2-like isoform X1 n=2 Tax=Petromyzon marinus TaxID=7757 RepID=A0AAJ7T3Y7_PETMA|nr:double-stranded RNA-binding protein Staufen homolog 2-like isoform X1 [Petromyzon marinus]XP_032810775.1 double-stranded RNA-binding protein Staufen homolog 2-like isoform X1 [Petromyzon marinus]